MHGFDPGVACRVELGGRFLWLLGFPDQALRTIQEAQALARSLGHPPSVTFALTFEAVLRQLRGEPAACLERTAEVLGTNGRRRICAPGRRSAAVGRSRYRR